MASSLWDWNPWQFTVAVIGVLISLIALLHQLLSGNGEAGRVSPATDSPGGSSGAATAPPTGKPNLIRRLMFWVLPVVSLRFYLEAVANRARKALGSYWRFALTVLIIQTAVVATFTTIGLGEMIHEIYLSDMPQWVIMDGRVYQTPDSEPWVFESEDGTSRFGVDVTGVYTDLPDRVVFGLLLTQDSLIIRQPGVEQRLNLGEWLGEATVVINKDTVTQNLIVLFMGIMILEIGLSAVMLLVVRPVLMLVTAHLIELIFGRVNPAFRWKPSWIVGLYSFVPATYLVVALQYGGGYDFPGLFTLVHGVLWLFWLVNVAQQK